MSALFVIQALRLYIIFKYRYCMKNLKSFIKQTTIEVLDEKATAKIKGGGSNIQSASNGHGCPPPFED